MWAFAALNGGALVAALIAAMRLAPPAAVLLAALSGYLILVHSSVLVAGLLSHLTTTGLTVLVAAALVGASGITRSSREPPLRPDAAVPFAPASLCAAVVGSITGALWIWPHLFQGTRLWVWDDYTYHMVYPALWLRQHAIAAASPAQAFTMQAWYPQSAGLVASWFMVPFSDGREQALAWVSLTGVLYAGMIAAGAAALCRRLGCRRGAWAIPVVLFATSSRTAIMAGSFSDADLAVAACLFSAVAFSIPASHPETARALWIDGAYASLLTGIALGVKVSAAAPALVVLVAMALRARALGTPRRARWRTEVGLAGIFAVAWSATAGYWYVRNAVHTGNPVYPAAFLGWPGATFPETTLLEYARRYGLRRAVNDALDVYLNWPHLHGGLAVIGLLGLAAWLIARGPSLTRAQAFFARTALAVTASVLIPLPTLPFSAGNAMTFRSGFVHWDSMRYVAILLLLGWAALGVLINAGAGASLRRTVVAVAIAGAGVASSAAPWSIAALTVAGALLGAAGLAHVRRPVVFSERASALGAGAAIVATMAIIAWSHGAKTAATRVALHGEPLFGGAAAVLDRQPSGTRIAVFGDQWVYPAFGDRLHLEPVRLDGNGDVATLPVADTMEPGDRTVDPSAFRAKLAAAGIEVVVVVRQPHPGRSPALPSQHAALEATADARLLYRDRAVAIWKLGAP